MACREKDGALRSEQFSDKNMLLTAIRRPISADINSTPRKAPKHAIKSILSIFQIAHAALKSTSPDTAEVIIAARIAFGV